MLRKLVALAIALVFYSEQVAAGVLARDGAVTIVTHGENWCGPTAGVDIQAPDRQSFDPANGMIARLSGLLQMAVTSECPPAAAVDIWGTVEGQTVYRGSAAGSDGWAVHAGSAAAVAPAAGVGGMMANRDGLVPTHWAGVVPITYEDVRVNGINDRLRQTNIAFYPQRDGRIRVRTDGCEGQLVVLRAGEPMDGAPQLGTDERLFRLIPPGHAFESLPDLGPIAFCGADGTLPWIVVRTEENNSLHIRLADHELHARGRFQTVSVEHGEGDLAPIYPEKPHKISEARASAGRGDGASLAALFLIGFFAIALMAGSSRGPSSYSGGGSAHYDPGQSPRYYQQNTYQPPEMEPAPPVAPINSFYAEPGWGSQTPG